MTHIDVLRNKGFMIIFLCHTRTSRSSFCSYCMDINTICLSRSLYDLSIWSVLESCYQPTPTALQLPHLFNTIANSAYWRFEMYMIEYAFSAFVTCAMYSIDKVSDTQFCYQNNTITCTILWIWRSRYMIYFHLCIL